MDALTLPQARRIVWDAFAPGPQEEIALEKARGRVLASDLRVDRDVPPFDRVAMDGYAVRAADTAAASVDQPVELRVVGAAMAGALFEGKVGAGEAALAMTGSALPAGADCVVPVESTAGYSEETARIFAAVQPGQNVAPRGQDLRAGERLLAKGTRLASQHVQALASSGWVQVPVVRPPSVAVAATGDELVPPQEEPGPGQIRESNTAAIQALLAELAIPSVSLGILSDSPMQLRSVLGDALSRFDVVVLSGGVSKGQRDHVKPVLRDLGVALHFESLHCKPGRPTTFGTHAKGAVFALPGNPVAVYATLVAVFGAGWRRWLGQAGPEPDARYGVLAFDARRRGQRPQLLPVRIEGVGPGGLPALHSTGHHGSGDFVSMARAGALALLPEPTREFPRGTRVELLGYGA